MQQNYRSFISDMREYSWIGLRCIREQDSVFAWTDGQSLQYANWAIAEPDLQLKVDCVGIYHQEGSNQVCVLVIHVYSCQILALFSLQFQMKYI